MRDAPPTYVSVKDQARRAACASREAWPGAGAGGGFPSAMKAIAHVDLPATRNVGLPLPRAARAPVQRPQSFSSRPHPGAREHGFGEDRRRAVPAGGEHLRVGASSAEREGFEPSVGFLLRPLSKRVPSATRSPLQALRGRSAKVAAGWRASRETSGGAASDAQIGLGPGNYWRSRGGRAARRASRRLVSRAHALSPRAAWPARPSRPSALSR